ncbi:MAG: hypothetical protein ACRDJ4_04425, partial [Actinomycetota bacterium]
MVRPMCPTAWTSARSVGIADRIESAARACATATGVGPTPRDLADLPRHGVAPKEGGVVDAHVHRRHRAGSFVLGDTRAHVPGHLHQGVGLEGLVG